MTHFLMVFKSNNPQEKNSPSDWLPGSDEHSWSVEWTYRAVRPAVCHSPQTQPSLPPYHTYYQPGWLAHCPRSKSLSGLTWTQIQQCAFYCSHRLCENGWSLKCRRLTSDEARCQARCDNFLTDHKQHRDIKTVPFWEGRFLDKHTLQNILYTPPSCLALKGCSLQ